MSGASERFEHALALVTAGTPLAEAMEAILAGGTGALVIIGDAAEVEPVCDGGFRLDVPFTPQRLVELAKMDGAIVVDARVSTIVSANVHLVPAATVQTIETGIRRRSADRVSKQAGVPVIAISRREHVARLYAAGRTTVVARMTARG